MIPLQQTVIDVLVRIALIIIIAIVFNTFLRSMIRVPHRLETKRGKTYVMVARNIISLLIVIIVLYFIFLIVGINVAPILASAGVIGIVIGIGARSLFEDLIAGFFLLSQSKISIGDYIILGNSIEGTVLEMGFKNLTLTGPNGALIIIPNGQVKQIVNNSYGKANNFIDITIKPGQDIDKIIQTTEKVIKTFYNDPKFLVEEESKILGITKITSPSAIVLTVMLISKSELRGVVDNEFRYRLIKAFDQNSLHFA